MVKAKKKSPKKTAVKKPANSNTVVLNLNSPLPNSKIQKLKEFYRGGSLARLKSHSRLKDINLSEINSATIATLPNSGEWLTVIFVANKAIKILFKTHYREADVKYLAMNAWAKKSLEEVTSKMIEDYIKEFCNLCAGLIKSAFDQKGFSQISLPLVTRAADDTFFHVETSKGKISFRDFWLLSNEKSKMACSVEIQIFDKDVLQKMLLPSFGGESGSGEVEFL